MELCSFDLTVTCCAVLCCRAKPATFGWGGMAGVAGVEGWDSDTTSASRWSAEARPNGEALGDGQDRVSRQVEQRSQEVTDAHLISPHVGVKQPSHLLNRGAKDHSQAPFVPRPEHPCRRVTHPATSVPRGSTRSPAHSGSRRCKAMGLTGREQAVHLAWT